MNASADADREPAVPAGPPAPPGGLAGHAPVHNLLHDYALKLRWSLLLNGLLAAALLPSAWTLAWMALHPPAPEYFATSADGRITPLVPIGEPYVPQEALLTWVAQAVNQSYTLDHVHRKEQLSRMRELFRRKALRATAKRWRTPDCGKPWARAASSRKW